MLRPEVDRLSDVDVAVDVIPKEPDRERARQANYARASELEAKGHAFRFPPARAICWKTVAELEGVKKYSFWTGIQPH